MSQNWLKHKLKEKTVTLNERTFINEQCRQLNNILTFLPDTCDSVNYNWALRTNYLNKDKYTTMDFKYQEATTSISNEILGDLKQVIMKYIYVLNIDDFKTNKNVSYKISTLKDFDYAKWLKKTILAKDNYDMTHIDMTDEEIVGFFQKLKFWNHIKNLVILTKLHISIK